jgi:hypothetical protein
MTAGQSAHREVPMQTITDFMSADHRSCDELLVAVEHALASAASLGTRPGSLRPLSGWHAASLQRRRIASLSALRTEHRHVPGPTQVMRAEHAQMRQLLAAAAAALAARDADDYAGNAETLLIMMQQHNVKEENVLYPMCDQHLADQTPTLLPELAAGTRRARRGCAMTHPRADIVIDARGLEPPEPLVRTMEALDHLEPAGKLLVLLPREPYPLYRALEINGFSWQTERQARRHGDRPDRAPPAVMQALLSFDQAPPILAPFRFFLTAPVFAMLAGLLLLGAVRKSSPRAGRRQRWR